MELNKCEFCGFITVTRKHHIIPRSKGGNEINKSGISERCSESVKTKLEEAKDNLKRYGFTISKNAKFWEVHMNSSPHKGMIGMEVGRYEHSCHIDTTDLIVLMFVDFGGDSVQSFSDFWLRPVK